MSYFACDLWLSNSKRHTLRANCHVFLPNISRKAFSFAAASFFGNTQFWAVCALSECQAPWSRRRASVNARLQDSRRAMNSGDSPRLESNAKNGTWCAATMRHTSSRSLNGTPARHSSARTSTAPRREWPGCPISPVTGSTTVVSGLQRSCSSDARNSASRRCLDAAWKQRVTSRRTQEHAVEAVVDVELAEPVGSRS